MLRALDEAARARLEAQARVMKALAHPTRLFIVEELSRGERCVCDLTELIGADISTVSKHLAQLRATGLVQDDKRGTQVFYRLACTCALSFFDCVEEVLMTVARRHAAVIGAGEGTSGSRSSGPRKEIAHKREKIMPEQSAAILVLCTGNSCRSQMAHAFLERHAGDRFPVYSAGSRPADEVHPLTVRVMKEVGLDLSGRRPRHLNEYLGRVLIHTLITVCDSAAKSCPKVWPGVMERLSWPFEDPAALQGESEEQTLAKFRAVRDAIEGRVKEWLEGRETQVVGADQGSAR